MKYLLLTLFSLIAIYSSSQIMGGTLVDEGRELLTETNFTINGTVEGYAVYQLAVDRKGNISSLTLEETNLKSTPTKVMIRNYVNTFTFTGASNYPEFQHVRLKITSVVNAQP